MPQTTQTTVRLMSLKRKLRRFIKTSHAAVLLVGCLHAKAMVNGEVNTKKNHWQNNRGLSIANPKSKAVILYLHGSVLEKLDDRCNPNSTVLDDTVPEVVQQLSGTHVLGLEVMVFAPCHGRATKLGEPLKIDQRVQAIDSITLGWTRPTYFLWGNLQAAGRHCCIKKDTHKASTLWSLLRLRLLAKNNGDQRFGNSATRRKPPKSCLRMLSHHSFLLFKTMTTTHSLTWSFCHASKARLWSNCPTSLLPAWIVRSLCLAQAIETHFANALTRHNQSCFSTFCKKDCRPTCLNNKQLFRQNN
jgi:hypothetical protein